MRQLSDLLDEARADAPPARYTVDDAVAAGRRRRRRVNAGWAIVTVAAVATAIGVPQLVTRAEPAPRPVVTRPAPQPAPSGKPAIEYTFAGYTAGRFGVENPTWWGLAGESAAIRPTATADQAGMIFVYRRGVDPLARLHNLTKTGTAPVHGRPAFFVQPTSSAGRWLVWEYATDAFAVIESRTVQAMSDAELGQLADAFPAGAGARTAVRVPVKAGYVTGDYKLVEVSADPMSGRATAAFVPAGQLALRLRDRGLPPNEKGQAGKVVAIEVVPLATPAGAPGVTCVDAIRPAGSTEPMGGSCQRPLPGGKYTLMVEAGPTVSQGEIRKMLEALDPADPADPGTWLPVSTAIPASSLPSGY